MRARMAERRKRDRDFIDDSELPPEERSVKRRKTKRKHEGPAKEQSDAEGCMFRPGESNTQVTWSPERAEGT